MVEHIKSVASATGFAPKTLAGALLVYVKSGAAYLETLSPAEQFSWIFFGQWLASCRNNTPASISDFFKDKSAYLLNRKKYADILAVFCGEATSADRLDSEECATRDILCKRIDLHSIEARASKLSPKLNWNKIKGSVYQLARLAGWNDGIVDNVLDSARFSKRALVNDNIEVVYTAARILATDSHSLRLTEEDKRSLIKVFNEIPRETLEIYEGFLVAVIEAVVKLCRNASGIVTPRNLLDFVVATPEAEKSKLWELSFITMASLISADPETFTGIGPDVFQDTLIQMIKLFPMVDEKSKEMADRVRYRVGNHPLPQFDKISSATAGKPGVSVIDREMQLRLTGRQSLSERLITAFINSTICRIRVMPDYAIDWHKMSVDALEKFRLPSEKFQQIFPLLIPSQDSFVFPLAYHSAYHDLVRLVLSYPERTPQLIAPLFKEDQGLLYFGNDRPLDLDQIQSNGLAALFVFKILMAHWNEIPLDKIAKGLKSIRAEWPTTVSTPVIKDIFSNFYFGACLTSDQTTQSTHERLSAQVDEMLMPILGDRRWTTIWHVKDSRHTPDEAIAVFGKSLGTLKIDGEPDIDIDDSLRFARCLRELVKEEELTVSDFVLVEELAYNGSVDVTQEPKDKKSRYAPNRDVQIAPKKQFQTFNKVPLKMSPKPAQLTSEHPSSPIAIVLQAFEATKKQRIKFRNLIPELNKYVKREGAEHGILFSLENFTKHRGIKIVWNGQKKPVHFTLGHVYDGRLGGHLYETIVKTMSTKLSLPGVDSPICDAFKLR